MLAVPSRTCATSVPIIQHASSPRFPPIPSRRKRDAPHLVASQARAKPWSARPTCVDGPFPRSRQTRPYKYVFVCAVAGGDFADRRQPIRRRQSPWPRQGTPTPPFRADHAPWPTVVRSHCRPPSRVNAREFEFSNSQRMLCRAVAGYLAGPRSARRYWDLRMSAIPGPRCRPFHGHRSTSRQGTSTPLQIPQTEYLPQRLELSSWIAIPFR